jgi:propanediol utilization protein
MTLAKYIEKYHNDYDTGDTDIIIDILLKVLEEFGCALHIDTDEQFLWVKIALIRKHVEECQ